MVIVIDTAKLVSHHGDVIKLCHMNSGATQPMAHPRGKMTFLSIEDYPLLERQKKYGPKCAVAEVTVSYAVPDILELATEVYETGGVEPRKDLL